MSPAIIAQLLALPSLRKQAEEDAFAYWVVSASTTPSLPVRGEDWDSDPIKERRVNLMAWLLADFTRWQSQAWALRRIGELLGWNIGDAVPSFDVIIGGTQAMVEIECDGMWERFASDALLNVTFVSGLPADRPGAIAAILLHLEGTQ